jgi:hypothetical protein
MQFLSKRGCFTKTAATPYTHLSMDGFHGGVVHVSAVDEPEMLSLYARDIEKGEHLYLTECKTPLFRFFIDTDFKFVDKTYSISRDGRLAILQIIYDTVQLFYPITTTKSKFRMIILDTLQSPDTVSDPSPAAAFSDDEEVEPLAKKKIVEVNADCPNNNMHIMFPWLTVNTEQAYSMGQAIACKLTNCIGDIGLEKNWFDVVDSSVYLSNGLRMIGSRKCVKCPACKGKRCNECVNIGKVDKGRPYRVCAVYQEGAYDVERLQKLTANFAQCVSYCSIRNLGATEPTPPGWKRYLGCPTIDSTLLKDKSATIDPKLSVARRFAKIVDGKPIDTKFTEDQIGQKKQKALCVSLPENTLLFNAAKDEVQRFDAVYRHLIIRSVMAPKNSSYYRVCVQGEGSSICFNLTAEKKEHNNNSIYFLVKPSGVYQRCWCSCETLTHRKNGLCKSFSLGPRPLLSHNLVTLFPNHKAPLLEQFLKVGEDELTPAEQRMLSRSHQRAFSDKPVSGTTGKKRKIPKQ